MVSRGIIQIDQIFFEITELKLCFFEERKSRPISRVLSRTVIHLGCKSPYSSSNLPRNRAGHASVPLFDLAPGGVYHATPVTSCAVRSYRTFSPLPANDRRYIFCGTFRRFTPPRRYLAPCPMEPGLSSILSCDKTATVQPTLSMPNISHSLPRSCQSKVLLESF